ncbi:hypothetical protein HKCCE3408_17740 [Rhodobacterales bacterium HKCCE3408]|nr:hypothetical protein [Rhodobacterales bacterium HKCCE3408]
MDTTVTIMVISIYAGAVFAPLAVFVAARRTGHGPLWQGAALGCAAVIWLILILGFAQQFLELTFFADLLDRIAFLGVVALAVLSCLGFMIAVRRWPGETGDWDDLDGRPQEPRRRISPTVRHEMT